MIDQCGETATKYITLLLLWSFYCILSLWLSTPMRYVLHLRHTLSTHNAINAYFLVSLLQNNMQTNAWKIISFCTYLLSEVIISHFVWSRRYQFLIFILMKKHFTVEWYLRIVLTFRSSLSISSINTWTIAFLFLIFSPIFDAPNSQRYYRPQCRFHLKKISRRWILFTFWLRLLILNFPSL